MFFNKREYDSKIQYLNSVCDSIRIKEESIIDSLNQEIGYKESVIDSLFSVRNDVIENTIIIKQRILELPLDSSVSLLKRNLENYEKN